MLDIAVEPQAEGSIRVALKGRLDTQTYQECEQRLEPLLSPSTRVLVLDLGELDYLSSMGLRVLMKITTKLTAHGGKCLLSRVPPAIRAVIDIADALPAENIFTSVEGVDQFLDVLQRRARQPAG